MRIGSQEIQKLAVWYEQHAKPFLQDIQPEKVEELNKDLDELLTASQTLLEGLAICFLGTSGVGKSTLINALVSGAETIVPSGGIGPLTAQALTIRYSEEPRLEVEYQSAQNFWRLIFALEQSFRNELEAIHSGGNSNSPTDDPIVLDPAELDDIAQPPEATAHGLSLRDEYRKSAQLLVTGEQNRQTELPYLIDSLREAAGKTRIWGTQGNDFDRERMTSIQAVLGLAKEGQIYQRSGSANNQEFMKDVRAHASGFLAPLIKNLTVYWNSEALKEGLTFVDLPGIGVAGDVYRAVTVKWIREKAQAIILVVDSRGVTESVAELLRKSEFLARLLYSADEPEDDPILIVAVVRVDDIAETQYAADRTRKKREHFADVCTKAKQMIREQLQPQLEATQSSGESIRETQQQVIRNILHTLQVHPLSAVQYRKLLANDEDDRPFIADAWQSNVPELDQSLRGLAKKRYAAKAGKLKEKYDNYVNRVMSTLKVIRMQWQEETRANEEAERLRAELLDFLAPLRKELLVRQGQYRAFLKKTMPQRIADLVTIGGDKAQKEINRYLNRLGYTHWATLRASVRRGGRFSGATEIDLPREFALRFEEPIAEAWSKRILKDIRRETKEYAADCISFVEEVIQWARAQGARVQPQLVEAQYEAIKADAKRLETVGREMVDELRDEARSQLVEKVDGPIRDACRRFVHHHKDVGPGVKGRILTLFEQLPEEVSGAAAKPATDILTKLFREVEREIAAALDQYQDPLTTAAEAIASSQESYLKRSDAQKKKKVLAALDLVLSTAPLPIEVEGQLLYENVA